MTSGKHMQLVKGTDFSKLDLYAYNQHISMTKDQEIVLYTLYVMSIKRNDFLLSLIHI